MNATRALRRSFESHSFVRVAKAARVNMESSVGFRTVGIAAA